MKIFVKTQILICTFAESAAAPVSEEDVHPEKAMTCLQQGLNHEGHSGFTSFNTLLPCAATAYEVKNPLFDSSTGSEMVRHKLYP